MDRHLVGHVAAVSVGIIDGIASCSTSTTPRTRTPRSTSTSSARTPARTSSSRAPPRASRSTAPSLDELLDLAERGPRAAVRGAVGGARDGPPLAWPARRAARPRRLLVATRSRHKLRELRELLDVGPTTSSSSRPTTSGIADEPDETGETFETNARLKARFYARRSGLPTLADDSGPRGRRARRRPGRLHAALRRSGRDRRRRTTPSCSPRWPALPGRASAARATCACWRSRCRTRPARAAGSSPIVRRGTCRGRIATAPRGDGGFGYDPIFEPEPGAAGRPDAGRVVRGREERDLAPLARGAPDGAGAALELGF